MQAPDAAAVPTPTTGYGAFSADAFTRRSLPRRVLGTRRGLRLTAGVALATVAFVGVWLYASQEEPQVQALRLVRPLAANTQVTAADVAAFTLPVSSVPDPSQLITQAQIASGRAYTSVALAQSAMLTLGAVGPYARTLDEVPAGMQLASITAPASMAAGGTIRAGDLVDVYVIVEDSVPADLTAGLPTGSFDTASTPSPSAAPATAPPTSLASTEPAPAAPALAASAAQDAQTVLAASTVRVLPGVRILDVQVDLDPIANANVPAEQAPGPDSPALKGGVPTTYQVAVSPDQARLLAFAAAGGGDLYLTIGAPASSSSSAPGS